MDGGDRRVRIEILTKMNTTLPRDGGALRTRAIADHLTEAGYNVTISSVKGRAPGRALRDPGLVLRSCALLIQMLAHLARYPAYSLVKWISWGVVVDIARSRRTKHVSYTLIDSSQIAIYAPICKLVVAFSLQNVESDLLSSYAKSGSGRVRRLVARYDSLIMRRFETWILKQGSPVFVVSDHDRDVLQRINLDAKVIVTPNGVSDECFGAERPRSKTVVFVASLDWQPNIDAAVWLARTVWPAVAAQVCDAKLFLIGRAPARRVWDLRSESVSVIPDVVSVIPYVAAARVATAPLHSAGGTRLKILEALACGTPVVATPLGALGLESAFDEEALRIRADPLEFAEELVSLLKSGPEPALREACRAQSVPFKWSNSLSPMTEELGSLIRAPSSGSR